MYFSDAVTCSGPPKTEEILGILLCLAGMCSYFPQYYSLIKSKQTVGVSELSLFILNVGSACLVANSVILNWSMFQCYQSGGSGLSAACNFWICTANLLPLWQISVGWLMVLPLYLIFIRFKRLESERHCLYDLAYLLTYVIFIMVILIVSLVEEYKSSDPVYTRGFFLVFSKILGIIAAVLSCVVWIPQIVDLLRFKNPGSLSLGMFLMQAPGNIVIIIFQAVLSHQDWSTWISYLITFIQQSIIVVLIIYFKCRRSTVPETFETNETDDLTSGTSDVSDVSDVSYVSDVSCTDLLINSENYGTTNQSAKELTEFVLNN